jgi:hypothetical protein
MSAFLHARARQGDLAEARIADARRVLGPFVAPSVQRLVDAVRAELDGRELPAARPVSLLARILLDAPRPTAR